MGSFSLKDVFSRTGTALPRTCESVPNIADSLRTPLSGPSRSRLRASLPESACVAQATPHRSRGTAGDHHAMLGADRDAPDVPPPSTRTACAVRSPELADQD
jgi:hypothetical protein